MRKILSGFVLVAGVAFATAAIAQGTGSSGNGGSSATSQSNGGGSGGTTAVAPVGHRQPRTGDVPDEKNDVTTPDPRDAALDRALRSICRGC